MDYRDAKDKFGDSITSEMASADMKWFTASSGSDIWGILPIIQVTAKNDKVVEILARADFERHGISVANRNAAEALWSRCVSMATESMGGANKIRPFKYVWYNSGCEIKIKLVKSVDYGVEILVSI